MSVSEGELYDVKLTNLAESDHFHNALFVAMYDAGFHPIHADFAAQEVEFSDGR